MREQRCERLPRSEDPAVPRVPILDPKNLDATGLQSGPSVPFLLTVHEVATLLRTTSKGVYAMVERGLLPGITRIGRRVLIRRDDLLEWLGHKSAPSPKE
jgi:excisionase family DNA binding protein